MIGLRFGYLPCVLISGTHFQRFGPETLGKKEGVMGGRSLQGILCKFVGLVIFGVPFLEI